MVYAHQLPSISPSVRMSHEIIPQSLPRSTHSSRPPRRAMSAPIAMLNGTATSAKPAICSGGWMNIPKCISSGLMPCPSGGVAGSRSSGFAKNIIIAKKNSSTSAIVPSANGVVCGRRLRMVSTAIADTAASTSAR